MSERMPVAFCKMSLRLESHACILHPSACASASDGGWGKCTEPDRII